MSEREDAWFDHLVYMRVFEGCNLHCKHCFIPSNPKRMSMEDVKAVPGLLKKAGVKEGSNILLQFHGGEPTLMGSKWINEAAEHLVSTGHEYQWRFSIQTNLMVLDIEWINVFKRWFPEDSLGVSWDADIRLTHKKDEKSNQNFERIFWGNYEKLLQEGIKPRLVVTVTKVLMDRFKSPYRLIEFLRLKGVENIHFERLTKTGFARENWEEIGITNKSYSEWMARLLRAYAQIKQINPYSHLQISPLDGILASVKGLLSGRAEVKGSGCLSGACDSRFHTIDANGYKRGCTALTSEVDNKQAQAGVILVYLDDLVEMRKDRTNGHNCASCQFRQICSSGCMAIDINDGSGECSGGYLLFSESKKIIDLNKFI